MCDETIFIIKCRPGSVIINMTMIIASNSSITNSTVFEKLIQAIMEASGSNRSQIIGN